MQPQHEATLTQPFTLRERSYSCKAQWNSIDNSSTSTTCNPIYIAGTILELQITMKFHRQLIHQHHLQSHLHCGNDPTVAKHNGIPSATPPPAPLAIPFTVRERSYSCKSQWNSICNSSTSTTCNPIYIAGTILQLQSTMEFHRQLIHQHHLQSHLHCGNDPRVANHNDHRQLILKWGNDPRVANHNGIPSATPPPAPLAIPFTLRERSYSCNHNGILSTTHARNTAETPFTMRNRSEHDPNMIRDRSDHDPTTHETVSHPSHRRGRSSTFGDGLCMEKHRVSCICYLSKTHFVRDFLQNSIGNSSTSTTCNAIYSEGTILKLQITMQFHQQLVHQQHLQPHLQCGNDPTVANHNGILSTTHARKTVDTPFTMRNRSENDPRMIRDMIRAMIRPHTRPSRTRRTAEVDPMEFWRKSHRRGRSSRFGDADFVWKNIGFRASAISQKRISCETSSKTPSATPPPAPLAMPFTVRERS